MSRRERITVVERAAYADNSVPPARVDRDVVIKAGNDHAESSARMANSGRTVVRDSSPAEGAEDGNDREPWYIGDVRYTS